MKSILNKIVFLLDKFFYANFFYKRKNIPLKIIYAFFFKRSLLSKNITTFFCYKKKKVVYLDMPKAACSSIRMTFFKEKTKKEGKGVEDVTRPFRVYFKDLKKNNFYNFYKFTFVRNPFSRIVSCFNDKVQKNYFYKSFYFILNDQKYPDDGDLNKIKSAFKSFLKKINKIPDFIADGHFRSQYSIVFYKDQPLFDYVGKIENFPESFEPMRKKFNLEKLGYHNVTSKTTKKKWQDFYDEETAALVYKRYQKDFTTWYPEAYKELLHYMKNK